MGRLLIAPIVEGGLRSHLPAAALKTGSPARDEASDRTNMGAVQDEVVPFGATVMGPSGSIFP